MSATNEKVERSGGKICISGPRRTNLLPKGSICWCFHWQVGGGIFLGVTGLWAKGKRTKCQLPIEKLRILEEKTTSPAQEDLPVA